MRVDQHWLLAVGEHDALLSSLLRLSRLPPQASSRQPSVIRLFASAMNAKQLVVEIAALPKLVESQKAAGLGEEEIIKSMYNSWQARLSAIKIPASNVEEITSALCAQNQPWLPDQRAALARTVMERQSVGGLKSIRRSMQSCPHYENMLTEEDWAELRTS